MIFIFKNSQILKIYGADYKVSFFNSNIFIKFKLLINALYDFLLKIISNIAVLSSWLIDATHNKSSFTNHKWLKF